MSVPQAVQDSYDRARPVIESVATIVKDTIEAWTGTHEYFFRGRIKSAGSTAEKLETGRYTSWTELDDLYAAEIVVPTLEQIAPTVEYLQRTFREHEIRGRGVTEKRPTEFRFDAVRFVGTLIRQEGIERLPGVYELLFEVQILTAFEYAWQVATHDLVYKGDEVDWRRLRLAAYLRASAEQADSLIASFENTLGSILRSPERDTERREHIVRVCKQEVEAERLSTTLTPESWVRFGENVLALVKRYAGREVDGELDRLLAAVVERGAQGPVTRSGSLFQVIVAAVVCLNGTEALGRFPIVPSSELRDIHRIADIPNEVAMWQDPG